VRHPVLHLTGVLRAAVDQPLVLFLRHGIGDLAFQVEVLLSTDFERPAQGMGRAGQRCCRIAAAHRDRWQHITLFSQRLAHVQHSGQRGDVGHDQPRGPARQRHLIGYHQTQHLANVLHFVDGKHRLVTGKRRQHRVTWHIAGQNDPTHAGQGQCCRRIHTPEPTVGHARQDRCRMQGAAQFGQVVDIGCRAGNLSARTLVVRTMAACGLHRVCFSGIHVLGPYAGLKEVGDTTAMSCKASLSSAMSG